MAFTTSQLNIKVVALGMLQIVCVGFRLAKKPILRSIVATNSQEAKC